MVLTVTIKKLCPLQNDIHDSCYTMTKCLRLFCSIVIRTNITTVSLFQGLPEDRITLTRVAEPDVDPPAWPSDIRLVDDQSVMYGRLQVHYKGHWRGVCANSQKLVMLLLLVARID